MLSNKAKKEILRTSTTSFFPYLLEIYHPNYGTFRYANTSGIEGVTFEGNFYQSASFDIQPPEHTNTGVSNASLTLSAIDQEWIIKIRETHTKATAKLIEAICIIGENGIEVESAESISFSLTQVQWNDLQITWTLVFDDSMDISVPIDVATQATVPGA